MVGSERQYFAELWNALQFVSDRELPVMARNAFMIGQRGHAPLRHLIHVPKIGVENARATAVKRPRLVVCPGRSRFLELFYPANLTWTLRRPQEQTATAA